MPRSRSDLRRYQRVFLNISKRIPHLILALPMGSGKTATVLTAALDLLDDREVSKVLIVAPLLVAAATWPDEIEEWEHTSLLEWTLIRAEDDDLDVVDHGKSEYSFARNTIGLDSSEASSYAGLQKTKFKSWKKAKLANSKTEMHIINREALPWLWDHFKKGKTWPYDMIIVDEASMFKNGKMRTPTKLLTRFGVMAKARKRSNRTILLTGTPAPKGLANLWGLSFIADLGERLGNSRFRFEEKYFDKGYMGWEMKPKPKAKVQIMDKLSDIMFSMREEDCVNLKPKYDIDVPVDLPPKVMRAYKEFEERLYSETYSVEAFNKGVLHGKLLQFANGSLYNSDRDVVWVHDEKLQALEQIVEDANGTPILLAYSYKFDLERIRKIYKKAKVFGEGDTRKMKAAWNNGEIEMLLAHPMSIGHGQNIQFGGNISVWYGLNSDLELTQQFDKRLHRPGQKLPVFNHRIIARGTLDEKILPILDHRESEQQDILDCVRVRFD